jgi:DNA-binding MarR family transcriptional regulator
VIGIESVSVISISLLIVPTSLFDIKALMSVAVAEDRIDRVLADWNRLWPELAVEPVAIVGRLQRVRAHMARELEALFARYGLTLPAFEALAAIRRREPPYELTQRALARELGLTAGTVSVRVDRLAELGLARRKHDPSDARGAVVALTRRGNGVCEQLFPEHLVNEERLLAPLSGAERRALAQLLRKLLLEYEP